LNGSIKKVVDFFTQVRAELLKIEWPNFEEFVGSTIITLILVTIFTIFIFGVDQAIQWLARAVFAYTL
jgi:preprotein translocase subunit SecE